MNNPRLCNPLSRVINFPRLLAVASLSFAHLAEAQEIYILTTSGSLAKSTFAAPDVVTNPVAITGVTAGESLVAIDVRPQNQRLYALGVNPTADTATLYHVTPETGLAVAVGTASSFELTTDGFTPVDFPDPATVDWDIDFNPSVDRLRVIAGSLNFRVNPNTGAPVDGNGGVANTNPDGAINGGTTTISATAYTNSTPNNGGITTQYTVDAVTDSLFIQNPPNNGTQALGTSITLGGNPLDISSVRGFDIAPGVNAASSNTAVATGTGLLTATVGGTTSFYTLDLTNAAATLLGTPAGATIRSAALRTEVGAAIFLSQDALSLGRFNPASTGTVSSVNLSGVNAGEVLVGIDLRPHTGQLMGLGVDATANTGTVYLIDPQGASATAIGTPGSVAFVDSNGSPVDLPPASAGYGVDFNPTVDRLRVVTGSGLNFRINPITGAPVDGNAAVAGVNPDGSINGLPGGSTGVDAVAYTNVAGDTTTTQYTLDSASGTLFIQNPPNNGTQTTPLPVTLDGSPLVFTASSGFDIQAKTRVTASGTPADGSGFAMLNVGGVSKYYSINLSTGAATFVGNAPANASDVVILFRGPEIAVEVDNVKVADGASVDFGPQLAGGSVVKTVKIKNYGDGGLTYTTPLNFGERFAVTQNNAGTVRQTPVLVDVAFSPTDPGTNTDTLFIQSDDLLNTSFNLALTGKGLFAVTDDAVTVVSGDSRLNPLANDGIDDSFTITAVSEPSIAIDGRSLIIPASFTGTFTYTVSDGGDSGQGTVTVTAGTAVQTPGAFHGVLRADTSGDVVGSVSAKISLAGVTTAQIRAGTLLANAKVNLGTVGTPSFAYTTLGYVRFVRDANGTISVSLEALGGDVAGILRPVVKTATVAKHHIALASIDTALQGGGFAIATVSKTGAIKVTGTLIDGLPFKTTSGLLDNGTFSLFTPVVGGAKPPAFLAGELVTANLTKTDVTGELSYLKYQQFTGAKGTHLGGIDTVLNANGSLYNGTALITAGPGTLTIGGGNLNATETGAVTIDAKGVPSIPTGSLKTWTGVAKPTGKFSATIQLPNVTKPVKGSGIYLPKSDTAWGYFPGTTDGGFIELTAP